MKLSDPQRQILSFLAEGLAPYLHFYNGPPGAEGRGAGFYWRQYDRSMTPPKLHAQSVIGLIRRGLLEYDTDDDYHITPKGRASLVKR